MPRRAPLVCQYLENISRDALDRYEQIIRSYVRDRQGIYALYRRGKLYYVGLASNLRSRLKHHLRGRHGESWDRFSVYLTIGGSHMKELESLILRIVKPKGNKQTGRFARSENLRGDFSKDIQEFQRRERDDIFGTIAVPTTRPKSRAPRPSRGRRPVLADYVGRRIALRRRYKGQMLKASVRADGMIRFGGKLYTSPSLAGAAACERRACNGWRFWTYERAPGDWVALDRLRK